MNPLEPATSTPLCSIIIRTYNRADQVAATVQSALDQDYPRKEVIVLDDGSTDHTPQVLEPFIVNGRIRHQRQENGGLQAARLTGFALAQGEYFIFYDTGDVWDGADYLSHAIGLLELHRADLGIINFRRKIEPYGDTLGGYQEEVLPLCEYFAQIPSGALEAEGHSASTVFALGNAKLREIFIEGMPAPSSGLLMRREKTLGQWQGTVRHGDDWMQALAAAVQFGATGVLECRRCWTKPITPDSTADGEMSRVKFLTTRLHDRGVMLENFRHLLTPAELAIFRRKMLSYHLDCAEDLLHARPRELAAALPHARHAVAASPRNLFRLLKAALHR